MATEKKIKLNIKNSPLISNKQPEKKKAIKKRVVKIVTPEKPEKEIGIVISSTTRYLIGWIAIRRTINKFNIFRRKPKTNKIGLWKKYTIWFNNKFNKQDITKLTDDNEILYEIVRSEK